MACLKARESEVKNPATGNFFCLSYSSNQKPGWRHMQTFHAANNPLQDWKLKPKRVCCNLPRKATILSSQSHQGIQDRSGMIPLKSEVHRPARVFVKKFTQSIFQDEVKPWYSWTLLIRRPPPLQVAPQTIAKRGALLVDHTIHSRWQPGNNQQLRCKDTSLHMVTLLVSSTFPILWIPDLEVVTLSFI